MHPDQRAGDQREQQHEAAGPQTGEIEQRAERDRQHETAKAADHADEAADRADILGVIDGDVLVDRGLAERHEEAQHEHRDGERYKPHLEVKGARSRDRAHHIIGRRVGENERAGDRDHEGPIHDPARAVAVRQMSAIGAEHAGRERKQRRGHAGDFDVDAVDVDEILRQPQRQRDEGAEHEEIVERESPDLNVLQGLKLEPCAFRFFVPGAPFAQHRIVAGAEPVDHRHDRDADGPNLRGRLPAVGDENERREELGDRGADIAGAEDTQRRALPLGRIPARHIGNADGERTARNANTQRRQQHLRIGVGVGQKERRHCRRQHHQRVDEAAAVLVGPDPERQPDQRAGENRRADQQPELRLVEAEFLFDADADDGEDRPHREAHGKGNRRHPQRIALRSRADNRSIWHGGASHLPSLTDGGMRRRPGRECFEIGQIGKTTTCTILSSLSRNALPFVIPIIVVSISLD